LERRGEGGELALVEDWHDTDGREAVKTTPTYPEEDCEKGQKARESDMKRAHQAMVVSQASLPFHQLSAPMKYQHPSRSGTLVVVLSGTGAGKSQG